MPALNQLLEPFGIALGDAVLEGQLSIEGEKVFYASGANIVRFPAGGHLHSAPLADKAVNGQLLTAACWFYLFFPSFCPFCLDLLHQKCWCGGLLGCPSLVHQWRCAAGKGLVLIGLARQGVHARDGRQGGCSQQALSPPLSPSLALSLPLPLFMCTLCVRGRRHCAGRGQVWGQCNGAARHPGRDSAPGGQ